MATTRALYVPDIIVGETDGIWTDARFYASLNAAVAAVGSVNDTTIVIASNQILTASLEITANITLRFLKQGMITIPTGMILTFNGILDAPLKQIFDCQGTGYVTGDMQVAHVYPQYWGAKGDGVTNDTDALQAAITFAANNAKELHLSPAKASNVYLTTSELTISRSIIMRGAGSLSCTIKNLSLLAADAYVLNIDWNAVAYTGAIFEGFTLMAGYGAGGTGSCLRVDDVSESHFRDIGLRNGVYGMVLTGTRIYNNVYERIRNITLIQYDTIYCSTFAGGGPHLFIACSLQGNTGFHSSSDSALVGVVFHNCIFEQSGTNFVAVQGRANGLSFLGCYFEKAGAQPINIDPAAGTQVLGLVIKGCYFNNTNPAYDQIIIDLGGSGGVVRGFDISDNAVMESSHNFTGALVRLNGDGESGTIANNYLDGPSLAVPPANCEILSGGTIRDGVTVYGNEAYDGKFTPQAVVDRSGWVDYSASASPTGWAGSPTVHLYYRQIGKTVFVVFDITGTSNGVATTFNLPATLASAVGSTITQVCLVVDNSNAAIGYITLANGANTVNAYPAAAGGNWTAANTKTIQGQFSYAVA